MIDKNIFIVWLGNNVPLYVNNVINTFKSVNPDFNVIFIHKDVKTIENIFYNGEYHDEYEKLMIWHTKHAFNRIVEKKKGKPFLMDLYDTYRFGLLCKYGGISVDCDMFPIKPFDDKLLSNDYFKMRRIHNGKEYIEGGFCGCVRRSKLKDLTVIGCIRDTELLTKELQDKFYLGTLRYGEHYSKDEDGNYVEHYGKSTWNKKECIVDKTKMDLDIDKIFDRNINFVNKYDT